MKVPRNQFNIVFNKHHVAHVVKQRRRKSFNNLLLLFLDADMISRTFERTFPACFAISLLWATSFHK